IMDFANDDNFKSAWISNPTVKEPWLEIDLTARTTFNTIVIAEQSENITAYKVSCYDNGQWKDIIDGNLTRKFKFHRFNAIQGSKIKITLLGFSSKPAITELQIYNENR
ncbi:MAG: discoidin domain-containing protein, partial [Sphingobacteriales bacterium]